MAITNENLILPSSLKFAVKGPTGKPLTTTDHIAVAISTDEDGDYAGFTSLTEKLQTLENNAAGYVKPEGGIPASDLSQDVLNLLSRLDSVGVPASNDYAAATYYVEGDTIPEGKNVGDVKTTQVGTAPTGLYLKIYNLEKTNEELNAVLDELLNTNE